MKKAKKHQPALEDGDGRKQKQPLILDPRFSKLQTDPKFQKLPRDKKKLPVDARFRSMLLDKKFSDPVALNKRGRPLKNKERWTLQRYYRIEDEETDAQQTNAEPQIDEHAKILGKRKFRPRKLAEALCSENSESGLSSEDSEGSESEPENDSDSSSSSSSSDSDREESQVEEEEDEKVATTREETRRLAVVNMDWQHIKAVDLLVLMKSFLPKGGQIQTVTIYPSQFGLQQIKEEDIHGPKRIFESGGSDEEEGDRIDMEKLRQYEKDKLRYYFAVVVCDSKATASFLYNTCDGTEFERTSNILDMRFIPDGMEFQTEPHDSASEVPDGYRAPEYETKALQLSNVKLTWEEDEPVRVRALRRKFNADELNEMDFAAYLASDDDDDVDAENDRKDEEKQDKREKYRQLLLGSGDVNPENARDDVDMEVTFPSGLSDLNKRLLEQKEKREHKDETVWEAYLRKKKEKKKSRMKEKDSESDNESDVSADIAGNIKMSDSFLEQDDDAFNDPFFKDGDDPEGNASKGEGKIGHQAKKNDSEKTKESHNAKKEEEKRRKQEEQQSKAELELLLMDDHALENGVKGFNLKSKGPKGKKKKKQNESLSNGISKKEELVLSTDYDDPRFSALYTNHHFAIDPTDPQFRRYASQLRPIVERQQQKLQEIDQSKSTSHERDDVGARKKKLELSSLVRSLKRKSMPHMLGNIV